MATQPTPDPYAIYTADCTECPHRVSIKLPSTEGHKPAVWGWCGNCGHMNWLEKK